METISYTKAHNKFASLMNRICEDYNSVIITRQNQPSVVLMSLEDYNTFGETAYLLRSFENSKQLNKAVIDFKVNKNFVEIK